MIVLRPTASTLEDRAYLTGKRTDILARKTATIDSSNCGYDLYNCKWPIPQFVDLEDQTDKYKNDYFSFMVEKDEFQTATITIENCDTEEINNITDNTYGDFYDFGDFTERPEVCVVYIDWYTVVGLMGFGKYRIKAEVYNSNEPPVLISTDVDLCFDVMPFSCDSAHGTIRFETIQTGYIHNGKDYRGLKYQPSSSLLRPKEGMKQQIRWYGRMWLDTPEEESDYHQISDRIEQQIQQKLTDKYKIELYRVHSAFGKHLTNDNFLATEIYVSDFNMNNYEVYRDKLLRKVSTDEVGVIRLNSGINLTLTFKEVDEGTVKRVWG